MLTLKAPAKINWFLHVLGKRNDGYHDIVSLMQWVNLYDSIVIEHSDEVEVLTESDIRAEDNLVYKAAMAIKNAAGIDRGVRIVLKKEIPMAAGMGGGSSDAAFTMMGLNRHWNLNMGRHELARLGAMLGSDVPFFFHGPASVIEGRGETVSPVVIKRSYAILLVKPPVDVSTAWGYGEIDRQSALYSRSEELTKKSDNIKLFCHALEEGDLSSLSLTRGNDFESLVISRYPVVGDIKQGLLKKGALFSAMSGSGPTVFGVFESEHVASDAMQHMLPNWCRVVRTIENRI
jgi:4-diphosphocytidyl-2-C-methyl-D-erythritol kinase